MFERVCRGRLLREGEAHNSCAATGEGMVLVNAMQMQTVGESKLLLRFLDGSSASVAGEE